MWLTPLHSAHLNNCNLLKLQEYCEVGWGWDFFEFWLSDAFLVWAAPPVVFSYGPIDRLLQKLILWCWYYLVCHGDFQCLGQSLFYMVKILLNRACGSAFLHSITQTLLTYWAWSHWDLDRTSTLRSCWDCTKSFCSPTELPTVSIWVSS